MKQYGSTMTPLDSAATRRPRVIAVTSGKGGVGKSNVVVNLSMAFAQMGKRVLIIDGDVGLGNVDILFDRKPRVSWDVALRAGGTLQDALELVRPHVSLLAAGSGTPQGSLLAREDRQRLVRELETLDDQFDLVLVDTAAGIGANAMFFAAAASDIAVVATPEPTAIADAYAAAKWLAVRCGVRRMGLIANCVASPTEASLLYSRLSGVVDRFLPVVMDSWGAIPEDQLLRQAVMRQEPVLSLHPDSPSGRAFRRLAGRIADLPDSPDADGRVQFFWQSRMQHAKVLAAPEMQSEWA